MMEMVGFHERQREIGVSLYARGNGDTYAT